MKSTEAVMSSATFKTLLAAVLDDCHGVSQEAWNTFCDIAKNSTAFSDALGELSEHIACSKGRVFLPEDWSEEQQ